MPSREREATPLEVDGSFGEGGGQILRTATCFSIIQGRPIHVTNVRSGRPVPGLRPQHAATLEIMREICGGRLEGGQVGSTEVTFAPGRVKSASLSLDLGTAASITLVLQAVVPAVALSGAALDLRLTGGTDVPWSPTADYISTVLRAALAEIGVRFDFEVTRRGYYPKGGGQARVVIRPCQAVTPVRLVSRAETLPVAVVSRCGMLPRHVAERQASSAVSKLAGGGVTPRDVIVRSEESLSPGSSVSIAATGGGCFIGADAVGARGKPAEEVGAEAAMRFLRPYLRGACVDPNLADMLAPLLCTASSGSSLLTSDVTGHLRTSLQVAEQFTGATHSIEAKGDCSLLSITPKINKIANKVPPAAGTR